MLRQPRRRPRASARRASMTANDLLGRRHALGARVVVGAEPSQRQVGLRRQHEREQPGAQVHARRRVSRSPMATATIATESVATSSRISEDRNVTRSVDERVRAVALGASRAIAATCARERPNTFSVGRPATTSRKWPPSRCERAQLVVDALLRERRPRAP